MSIDSVVEFNQLPGAKGTSQASDQSAKDLQNNFMTMLITQLKNQDPMNPMENAELTSQLAQINTVNGIEELNATLNGINTQIEAGQALQAASLIGKAVMVPGDQLLVGSEGVSTPFGIEIGSPAEQVTASIVDGSGQVVRSFDLGAMDAGYDSFVWDGILESGEFAPQGAYRVVVQAVGSDTSVIGSNTFNYALVQAVSPDQEGGTRLDLGGVADPVTLEDVRQIL
ncbi:MAG: flagellar hook assembly protein FlgD [Porticoccus sp.]|nr:flagellar hook assembly protein FlgD [Porticoccus sp.]MBQ0807752.1 flagellar hook assembly protein FlgD [Porticoccus sp.]